ncbi:MAG: UDP-N-acetylmuramate--L-alanine ligase [Neisseriaceae bacterium]
MKHKIKKIHFIGIGGVGMSGIAEVLFRLGYEVSGSDSIISYNTNRLQDMGIKIYLGHDSSNVSDVDVIVSSTAIKSDNPEIVAASALGITVVPRAMMLAELMRFKYGIAIAGTHGKTTTTSLCAEVLGQSGLDPTFLIGGKLSVTNCNAQLGSGEYLVAEADESDASFLYLNPLISVITNIDLDHMDTYGHDEEKLKQAFIDFLHRLPFYGVAILCNEDKRVREIIPRIKRQIVTYGLDEKSDVYAKDIRADNGKMYFTLCFKDSENTFPIVLNLPGEHNVLNALAVIAVGIECECDITDITNGLANFHGVDRRCQHYPNLNFEGKTIKLIDDYGHHPAELKATISALKGAYPKNNMILVFQPHRYTRTRDLFDEFVNVLSDVKTIIIMEVYAAGEAIIPSADGKTLVDALKGNGSQVFFVEDLDVAKSMVYMVAQDGDLVVTMGAGSIGKLPQMMIDEKGYHAI